MRDHPTPAFTLPPPPRQRLGTQDDSHSHLSLSSVPHPLITTFYVLQKEHDAGGQPRTFPPVFLPVFSSLLSSYPC